MKHNLYKTGDGDAPDAIKDRNGEVVLDLCRVCNRGEAELDLGGCVKPLKYPIKPEIVIDEAVIYSILENTKDAYSLKTDRVWQDCAEGLLQRGFTQKQVEGILYSVFMRWASDWNGSGKPNTAAVLWELIEECLEDGQMDEFLELCV